MIYLFHNVYGDTNELIAAKPLDCEVVPFGWTPEVEEYRNNLVAQLGCTVSCLPSVVYYQPAYSITVTNTLTGEVSTTPLGATWEELPVGSMEKPWSWDVIQQEIARDKNKNITINEDPA